MHERKLLSLSTHSFKLMIYGAFSVVCHLVAVLFYFLWYADKLPGALLVREGASMLEYSLMSIVIILVGALLFEIAERQKDDDSQK